jgi:excisionase family DNA binding protein
MATTANGHGAEITRYTPVTELPEYLTFKEFVNYLAIGRSLGYELVRTGKVESVRFGRLVRIPKSVLLAEALANSKNGTGAR